MCTLSQAFEPYLLTYDCLLCMCTLSQAFEPRFTAERLSIDCFQWSDSAAKPDRTLDAAPQKSSPSKEAQAGGISVSMSTDSFHTNSAMGLEGLGVEVYLIR